MKCTIIIEDRKSPSSKEETEIVQKIEYKLDKILKEKYHFKKLSVADTGIECILRYER